MSKYKTCWLCAAGQGNTKPVYESGLGDIVKKVIWSTRKEYSASIKVFPKAPNP